MAKETIFFRVWHFAPAQFRGMELGGKVFLGPAAISRSFIDLKPTEVGKIST
jgi:hypothetical protein